MRVAVLGLGEAGSIYAADLASRGWVVTGTDPHVDAVPAAVAARADVARTVEGADVVMSLVGAEAAPTVLAEALPAMAPHSIYADMNTAGPDDKKRLARAAAECGIPFVDVAIMAPVARARVETPLLLSGAGAAELSPLLSGIGIPVTEVGAEAGDAARLKLLRSVFMKGLAAVVYESVSAAEAFGAEQWVIDQIADELGDGGHDVVRHLIAGTQRHALRREAEMRDARELLMSVGAAHPMTDGTIEWFHRILRAERDPVAPTR